MNTPTNQSQTTNTPYGNLNFQIRQNRMYTIMKDQVVSFIGNVFMTLSQQQLNNHDNVARSIKMHLDKLYGPPWHCIVGKGFGSAVTYKNKNFLYLYVCNKAVMIHRH